MAETVFVGGLIREGAGARWLGVRASGVVQGKQPGGAGAQRFQARVPGGLRFGRTILGKS